jgi:hypothetical protein
MDAETLALFEAVLRQDTPDFQVKFKDESWTHKVIALLLSPFNPLYLTEAITTFGSTVYFPSRAFYLEVPGASLNTLAHEFVHISDSKKDPFFKLKYLFPQVLVVIPMVLYGALSGRHVWLLGIPVMSYVLGALACRKSQAAFFGLMTFGILMFGVLGWVFTGWKILLMLGLVLAGPWPAPWRREYEIRGYGMNVAVLQWRNGEVSKAFMNFCIREFTGPDYFYMCRDAVYLERILEATRQQAQSGDLQKVPPYGLVYDFLASNRFTFRAA